MTRTTIFSATAICLSVLTTGLMAQPIDFTLGWDTDNNGEKTTVLEQLVYYGASSRLYRICIDAEPSKDKPKFAITNSDYEGDGVGIFNTTRADKLEETAMIRRLVKGCLDVQVESLVLQHNDGPDKTNETWVVNGTYEYLAND